jgi:hypothetical protein
MLDLPKTLVSVKHCCPSSVLKANQFYNTVTRSSAEQSHVVAGEMAAQDSSALLTDHLKKKALVTKVTKTVASTKVSILTIHQWPVLYKVYNRKFMIVNYTSVWSVSYDHYLQS